MPKVSIIVPVYNVEKYLPRCMHSLLNQTLKEIEIILVDDGSPDNCPQMCDDYAERDERVRVIHKENAGLGFARNSGLDAATGEYVAFVDSDDCVALNTYEVCYSLAVEKKLDIVRFGMDRFTNDVPMALVKTDGNPIICRDTRMLKQLSLAFWGSLVTNSNSCLKKVSAASACGGLYNLGFINRHRLRFKSERVCLSEDFEFNYNALQKAAAVGFTQSCFYHYYKNPHSLTTTVKMDKVDKAIAFSKLMTQEMLRDGYSEYEAELHPMYYSLSIMRDVQKLVFLSDMSLHEKKEWFHKVRKTEYMKEIRRKYPLSRIRFKYNLSFKLTMGGFFYLSYLLVRLKGR